MSVLSKAPKKYSTDRILRNDSRKAKMYASNINIQDTEQINKAAKYLKTDKMSELLKEYDLFKKSNEIRKLKSGEFFGSRAVVNEEYLDSARYTVIADSHDVKVFIIKSKHFSLIPENHLVINI